MERKIAAFSAALVILFSGCFLPKARPSQPQKGAMVLRYAEYAHRTHPAALAGEYFARNVEKRTEGKIRIKVYYDGTLGTADEVLEQLRFGGIAIGRVSFAELNDSVPSIIPFSREIIENPSLCRQKIIDSMDFVAEKCLAEKLYPLSAFYGDKRCFYTESPRYFFHSMNNISGIKVGTSSSVLLHDVLRKYGALPVDIISSNTYRSMQKGYMNVREADFTDFVLGNDYLIANYVMISEYVSNPGMLMMSNEVWNQLSVEQRKIFSECARDAMEYQKSMMERFYTANLSTVQKNKSLVYLKESRETK